MNLSRRNFLKGVGAALAAALLPIGNGVAKTEEKTDYEPPGTVQWSYAYHVIGEEPGEAPEMHYSYGIDVAGDMDSYIRQALLHQCDLYRIERENEFLYGDGTAQPLGVFYVDEEVE